MLQHVWLEVDGEILGGSVTATIRAVPGNAKVGN